MSKLIKLLDQIEDEFALRGAPPNLSAARLASDTARDLQLRLDRELLLANLPTAGSSLAEMTYYDFVVFRVPLDRLTGVQWTEKKISVTSRDREFPLASSLSRESVVLVLHNLRSAYNVGNIFRLADGFLVEKVFCVGYTPTPEMPAVEKSSLGSQLSTPWEWKPNLAKLLSELKNESYQVVGLETVEGSVSLQEFPWALKAAIVVGNERWGLSPKDLGDCDQIVHIPMGGTKNSLNVTSALSIATYSWKQAQRSPLNP
jgi:23S rRNA (guanosine2251-2'-O)-methyltransferase